MAVEEEVVGVQVRKGIATNHINKLIYYSSNDDLVLKFTHDNKRYRDLKSFNKEKSNRFYYSLVSKNNELAGIIWFKKKPIPKNKFIVEFNTRDYGITFALRVYGKFRAKGLSYPFLKEAIKRYKKTKSFKETKANNFWVSTSFDNLPAIVTYAKFGFEKVSEKESNEKIIMIDK
ncbi:MAG: hypothetical protein ABIJ05_01365 [Patescibacteria group bacterium]